MCMMILIIPQAYQLMLDTGPNIKSSYMYTLLQKKCTLSYPSSLGDPGSLILSNGLDSNMQKTSLLSRPIDKIKMTRGWGRWPRDLRKFGWFSCALLLELWYHEASCIIPDIFVIGDGDLDFNESIFLTNALWSFTFICDLIWPKYDEISRSIFSLCLFTDAQVHDIYFQLVNYQQDKKLSCR